MFAPYNLCRNRAKSDYLDRLLALALRRAWEGLAEVARGRLRATETSPHVPFANGTPASGGVVFADQSPATCTQRRVALGWPLQRRLTRSPDA